MIGKLAGKVALITGTGGGQGRAAAVLFAKEGAKVVGCDLKVEGAEQTVEIARGTGGEMVSLQPVDLSEESQVKDVIDFTVKKYGRIDVLYNNAGASKFGAIDRMQMDDWRFSLRNELDVIYLPCHYAWPYLKSNGNGVIINTASIAGMVGSPYRPGRQPGPGNMFSHCAGKGAIRAMSRELALYGAPLGIRVIALCPGLVDVDGMDQMHELKELIPLNRLANPDDIAKTAVFLASDDASYITGVDIVVDGGYTAR